MEFIGIGILVAIGIYIAPYVIALTVLAIAFIISPFIKN
jgi:hypothetical protein